MTEKSDELDFKSLVDPSLWKDYDTYIEGADKRLEADIKKSMEKRAGLRKELLTDPNLRKKIRPFEEELETWENLLGWAESELFEGKVAAIDGTISSMPMVSGTKCRIGVVSTSYKNKRIERVLYVSEQELVESASSFIEYFENLKKKHRISNLLLRALMLYGERDLALKRPEKWKMVHGNLIPYELRTGLGGYKALPETLELGRKLIEAKNIIAVVEDTTRPKLLSAGIVLERGEFLEALSLKQDFKKYLTDAHFNRKDEKMFDEFIEDYCENIRIGVYRSGFKPYVFEAHKDCFDKAAALIMKDSENQSMRGFPLLIDYADTIASRLLSGGDFKKQVAFKTAKCNPNMFGFEMLGRTTRRRK